MVTPSALFQVKAMPINIAPKIRVNIGVRLHTTDASTGLVRLMPTMMSTWLSPITSSEAMMSGAMSRRSMLLHAFLSGFTNMPMSQKSRAPPMMR